MTMTESPPLLRVTETDERVAAGDWSGFTDLGSLLTMEGALELFASSDLMAANIREEGMNQAIALGYSSQPFRWKDKVYRVLKASFIDGKASVEVSPHDPEFLAEVCRHIEQDRFHTLTFYQGFGFVCFPEDYVKYQG